MPVFNPEAHKRIGAVVKRVEGLRPDQVDKIPRSRGIVPFEFRRFVLAETLDVGGIAGAYHRTWNGTGFSTGSELFAVRDSMNTFSGVEGTLGYAINMHDIEEWDIMQLACTPSG